MQNEDFLIHKLKHRNIKPTANRLMILQQMIRGNETVSLPDMERYLPTIDKSTISRTLALFLEHKLIHDIDDGSGAVKYAVCSDDCECVPSDEHIHFYCTQCHKTYCLKGISIPKVNLPEGFTLDTINYVTKGTCPQCNEKNARRI